MIDHDGGGMSGVSSPPAPDEKARMAGRSLKHSAASEGFCDVTERFVCRGLDHVDRTVC